MFGTHPCVGRMDFVVVDFLRPVTFPVANACLFPSKIILYCEQTYSDGKLTAISSRRRNISGFLIV